MAERYQKVAYIGLRNSDGSFLLNVPLYVCVDDLKGQDFSKSQEETMHKISEIMLRRYEKQLCEFLANLKNSKN